MEQFRLLPTLRLPDGSVAIWYLEGSPRPGGFRWIGERLQSIAAAENADCSQSVFVYADGAVAWFDETALHYITSTSVMPWCQPRPGPLRIATEIHQACVRTGALDRAIAFLTSPAAQEHCA